MKHSETWHPSRFETRGGRLCPTSDPAKLAVDSRLMAQLIADTYTRALGAYARGRLLDLGCGEVPFYGLYRDLVDEVTTVDWPGTQHETSHVDVFADLSEPLPLPDQHYDTVLLSDVLEHLPEPQRLLSEVKRVLRPRGHLLLNVPFLYPLHEAPHDFHRYTEFRLRELVAQAGLDLVELSALGGAPRVLGTLLGKALPKGPRGNQLRKLVNFGAGALLRTPVGRRLEASTQPHMPLMYFLLARSDRAA